MARKRFTPEQVITMLREAEVLPSQSNSIGEVCRKLGISEQTYCRLFGWFPPRTNLQKRN